MSVLDDTPYRSGLPFDVIQGLWVEFQDMHPEGSAEILELNTAPYDPELNEHWDQNGRVQLFLYNKFGFDVHYLVLSDIRFDIYKYWNHHVLGIGVDNYGLPQI
jgi:hypothetical protein